MVVITAMALYQRPTMITYEQRTRGPTSVCPQKPAGLTRDLPAMARPDLVCRVIIVGLTCIVVFDIIV